MKREKDFEQSCVFVFSFSLSMICLFLGCCGGGGGGGGGFICYIYLVAIVSHRIFVQKRRQTDRQADRQTERQRQRFTLIRGIYHQVNFHL